MKKVLLIIFALLLIDIQPAMAKNVKVKALSDFSTLNPPKTWSVEIVDSFETKDGIPFHAGSVVTGRIQNVTDPKRLKRNAGFDFIPKSYYDSLSGKDFSVKKYIVGKYSSLTDVTVGAVVKKGAVTAGNYFVGSFVGPSVALVEGAVKNEDGNRAKSAAKSVYESTPISYVEKGKELEIKKDQVFVMNFKIKGEDEESVDFSDNRNNQNYEYTIEK